MDKIKIVLLLCVAVTLAACGSSGSSHSNTAANIAPTDTQGTQGTLLSYMDSIKKMVAGTSDDTEPVDVEMVKVEQSDDAEVVEVM